MGNKILLEKSSPFFLPADQSFVKVRQYDPLTTKSIFKFSNNPSLRGHNFKISKQSTNKTKFANFFTNRVVNVWNKLPSYIVNAKTINEFKNSFDKHNSHLQFKMDLNVY